MPGSLNWTLGWQGRLIGTVTGYVVADESCVGCAVHDLRRAGVRVSYPGRQRVSRTRFGPRRCHRHPQLLTLAGIGIANSSPHTASTWSSMRRRSVSTESPPVRGGRLRSKRRHLFRRRETVAAGRLSNSPPRPGRSSTRAFRMRATPVLIWSIVLKLHSRGIITLQSRDP